MAIEIGKQYQSTLKDAVSLYRHGFFEEESKLIEQVRVLFHPIVCYSRSCLKRIEEKHILIENKEQGQYKKGSIGTEGSDKIRFHAKCIDKLANSN